MKTSVIRHPAEQSLILIRQWQLDFCNGNITQAALLSFFEHWHNIRCEIRDAARGQKKCIKDMLIQHHTDRQLIAGILNIAKSPNTIRPAVKALEFKGVITILKNPNPRFQYDKTRHYEFHPDVVNAWLDNNADKFNTNVKIDKCTGTGTLEGVNAENPHGSTSVKNDKSRCQNCHIDMSKVIDIPKIQTEIHTRDDRPVPKPTESESSVVVSFDFKDFNWPDRLKQSMPNLNALKPLPNNEARQEVLDVMANRFKVGKPLTRPTGFLRGLVKNYIAGDFTPVESQAKPTGDDNPVDVASCSVCGGTGAYRFDRLDGTFTPRRKCSHKPFKEREYIKQIELPQNEGGSGYKFELPNVN